MKVREGRTDGRKEGKDEGMKVKEDRGGKDEGTYPPEPRLHRRLVKTVLEEKEGYRRKEGRGYRRKE
jgi:hypothetical protein